MAKLHETATEGTRLLLIGKTQKGKNRIREAKRDWEILRIRETVLFSQETGPWALIIPLDTALSKRQDHFSRWVNLRSDIDFDIFKS